jgi:hypothetical protein
MTGFDAIPSSNASIWDRQGRRSVRIAHRMFAGTSWLARHRISVRRLKATLRCKELASCCRYVFGIFACDLKGFSR